MIIYHGNQNISSRGSSLFGTIKTNNDPHRDSSLSPSFLPQGTTQPTSTPEEEEKSEIEESKEPHKKREQHETDEDDQDDFS